MFPRWFNSWFSTLQAKITAIDEIPHTGMRHSTLRYKSKIGPQQESLKWLSTCALKRRQRDCQTRRQLWPVHGRLYPDRNQAHDRGDDRANTSPATRSVASQSCVASARSCTSLRVGRTIVPNGGSMYAPLYFSRSAATSTLVAAKSVVQAPWGAGMHVSAMSRFSHHGLYALSASVQHRQRTVAFRDGEDAYQLTRFLGEPSSR